MRRDYEIGRKIETGMRLHNVGLAEEESSSAQDDHINPTSANRSNEFSIYIHVYS